MKRGAGWRLIAIAALVAVLFVATACSRRSVPVASTPTVKRTVDQTQTLVGTWVPRTTVELLNRSRPPIVEALRLESDGRMSVGISSSIGEGTSTGSWSLIPPYAVRLKLGAGAKARSGAYLLGAHASYLRLTAVEGDTWATGVDTSTVLYDRQP